MTKPEKKLIALVLGKPPKTATDKILASQIRAIKNSGQTVEIPFD